MTITAGQLVSALQALPQLGVDTSAAAGLNLGNLAADATVGEDVLSVVAIFWPPAGLLAEALAVAIALAPIITASGITVSPDPLPMTDAQTSMGRGGRGV